MNKYWSRVMIHTIENDIALITQKLPYVSLGEQRLLNKKLKQLKSKLADLKPPKLLDEIYEEREKLYTDVL